VDLFVPSSGAQVHDFNGGILASGLFWTLPVPDDALWISHIALARSTGFLEGSEFGFAFEARGDTKPSGWAQVARERNGVCLS
jgi:hypothetical protein